MKEERGGTSCLRNDPRPVDSMHESQTLEDGEYKIYRKMDGKSVCTSLINVYSRVLKGETLSDLKGSIYKAHQGPTNDDSSNHYVQHFC